MHKLATDALLFDIEKTYEYILSIRVRPDGFSFLILSNNQPVASKTIQQKISSSRLISRHFAEWIESEDILQRPFSKTSIVVFSEGFSLIPDEYFEETLKTEISNLLFNEDEETEIAVNSISTFKTRLLFTLPEGLNKVIQDKIGECEIIHPVKTILNHIPKIKKKNGLILLFNKNSFFTVLFTPDKILLANNFKMAHATDVVFYVLSILKQHNIKPAETELFITETEEKYSETEKALLPYFSTIQNLRLVSFLGVEEVNK